MVFSAFSVHLQSITSRTLVQGTIFKQSWIAWELVSYLTVVFFLSIISLQIRILLYWTSINPKSIVSETWKECLQEDKTNQFCFNFCQFFRIPTYNKTDLDDKNATWNKFLGNRKNIVHHVIKNIILPIFCKTIPQRP